MTSLVADDPGERPSDPDIQFKALMLGDSGIGKTCLLDRLLGLNTVDWNDPQFVPTSKCSFDKIFKQKRADSDRVDVFEGEFWDTAGRQALKPLRAVAFKDADITMIAYDMTRPSSLQNICGDGAGGPSWHKEVLDHGNDKTGIILVGTKHDLWMEMKEKNDENLTTYLEARKVAARIGAVAFLCTSAKSGYGVLDTLDELQTPPCTLLDKILEIALHDDFAESYARLEMPPIEQVPQSPERRHTSQGDGMEMTEFVVSPDGPRQSASTDSSAQNKDLQTKEGDNEGDNGEGEETKKKEKGCGCCVIA